MKHNRQIKHFGRLLPNDLIAVDEVLYKVIQRHRNGRGVQLENLQTREFLNIALHDQTMQKYGYF